MSSVLTLPPLTVLAKVCELRGWALVLRSTGDDRPAAREHGLRPDQELGSRLTRLEVVAPDHRFAGSRGERIAHGDLLATRTLRGNERPDEVAVELLASLRRQKLIGEDVTR